MFNLVAVTHLLQKKMTVLCFIAIIVTATTATVKTMAHYPFHASCSIDWLVNSKLHTVVNSLLTL